MKRDKQQSTFVNIGSSSLLIIFLVLSLTTFAILSLSSAQSDYSFSKRLAEHKTEYYEASSRAELILGEIDRILAETAGEAGRGADADNSGVDTDRSGADAADTDRNGAGTDGSDADATDTDRSGADAAGVSFTAALAKLLDGKEIDGISVSCTNSDGKVLISYEVPSGEKQALKVTLLVTDAAKEEHYYKIEAWQLISTSDWNADDTIQLMPMQ